MKILLAIILSYSALANSFFGDIINKKTGEKIKITYEGSATLKFTLIDENENSTVIKTEQFDTHHSMFNLDDHVNAPTIFEWSDRGMEFSRRYLRKLRYSEVRDLMRKQFYYIDDVIYNYFNKIEDIHDHCTDLYWDKKPIAYCFFPIPGYPIAMVATTAGYAFYTGAAFAVTMATSGLLNAVAYGFTPVLATIDVIANLGLYTTSSFKVLFSKKARAARKLKKAVNGKDLKVSNRLFKEILDRLYHL